MQTLAPQVPGKKPSQKQAGLLFAGSLPLARSLARSLPAGLQLVRSHSLAVIVAGSVAVAVGAAAGGGGVKRYMLHIQVPVCFTYHMHVCVLAAQDSSRVSTTAVSL